jgi:hypothetical protein
LAFTLLRAMQLLSCCYNVTPTHFIQVKWGSVFAEYLRRRGFEYVTREVFQHNATTSAIHSMHWQMLLTDYDPPNTPGFVWHPENEDGYVTMQCVEIVSWSKEQKWTSKIFDSWKYHYSNLKTNKSTWPNAYHICNLPVAVDGLFLDQCA